MTALTGKVLARREADEVTFLVVGQVGCHQSPAMRQYAEDMRRSGARKVAVEFAECKFCDSTFLGTLLSLKRVFEPLGGFVLVRPSAAVRQILSQLGAERLFAITEQGAATDIQTTWQQLDSHWEKERSKEFKKTVVEAHEELAAMGGTLEAKFKPLAEAMREEWNANQR
jgi:anti-anti-sigma regulatory factor